jgi:hypothetical protein
MIAIESNVGKVLKQVEALKVEVPRAVRRALEPQKWLPRAREVALATINGLAEGDERRFTTEFARRVVAGTLGVAVGFYLELNARQQRAIFGTQQDFFGDTPQALTLIGLTPAGLEDLLLQWVNTPESEGGKRLDERDAGKSDSEIVAHLMQVLFAPGNYEGLEEARQGLLPHIIAFHQQQLNTFGLKPETVDLWLRAILAAWRDMVRDEIGQRIRAELKAKKFP